MLYAIILGGVVFATVALILLVEECAHRLEEHWRRSRLYRKRATGSDPGSRQNTGSLRPDRADFPRWLSGS